MGGWGGWGGMITYLALAHTLAEHIPCIHGWVGWVGWGGMITYLALAHTLAEHIPCIHGWVGSVGWDDHVPCTCTHPSRTHHLYSCGWVGSVGWDDHVPCTNNALATKSDTPTVPAVTSDQKFRSQATKNCGHKRPSAHCGLLSAEPIGSLYFLMRFLWFVPPWIPIFQVVTTASQKLSLQLSVDSFREFWRSQPPRMVFSNLLRNGITLPETNIAPKNRQSQKETSIPTIHF